jgi:GNAT superfamily N-acetyltransferase
MLTATAALGETTHSLALPARRPAPGRPHLVAVPTPTTTASVWWARMADGGPASQEHSLVAVNSERFADGTPVDMTAIESRGRRPAGWLVDVRYRATDGTVLRIDTARALAELCPPLWFAELHHATSNIPASSLLAFTGTAFRPGAVVTPREVAAAGVRMADRIGELRWYNRSGIVDAVTVAPAQRRRGVGTVLVTAAEALRVLRGWAPLRSDGRLTDAGAAWLAAAPPAWRPRLAARTEALPDPDEADDGPAGVTRLLR